MSLAGLGIRQQSSVPSGEVNYLLYLKSAENSIRTWGVCMCEGLIVLHLHMCVIVCTCACGS